MLEVSVPIAHELLGQCVNQGQALVQRASLVGDFSDYESWKAARNQWIEPTVQALEHMYDGPDHGAEFVRAVTAAAGGQRWQQHYAADLDAVKAGVELLTDLRSDLVLASEDASPPGTAQISNESEGRPAAVPEGQPARELEPAPELEPQAEPERERQPASELEPVPADPDPARAAREPEPARPAAAPPAASAPEAAAVAQPAEEDAEEARRPQQPGDRDEDAPVVGAELAPAPPAAAELAPVADEELSDGHAEAPAAAKRGAQVLLAHGRNERWLHAVARLLEHAGRHDVAILNERLGRRGVLAEQFGEHAPGSRYAVVLLTADDIGAPRVDSEDEPYYSPRAHQAVVFEMGFLIAALAPGRVCVLYEEGVQLPCEMDDVTYVRLDMAGTWQPKLLLQLRKAGLDYDLNKLVAA
jgi:predicted nucleotide-binding protein